MKTFAMVASVLAFTLLLALGSIVTSRVHPAGVAFAQEATAAPTGAAQPVVTTQQAEQDDNDFPWGILGLLGLAGLAGLRRQPEPVRQQSVRQEPARGAS